jgi:hypothetical protein
MNNQALAPAHLAPAQKARQLLFGVQQQLSRIGRHRLEDEPDSGWEAETRRAIAYHERHHCTWEAAARHIGISPRQLRERRNRLRLTPFTADPEP